MRPHQISCALKISILMHLRKISCSLKYLVSPLSLSWAGYTVCYTFTYSKSLSISTLSQNFSYALANYISLVCSRKSLAFSQGLPESGLVDYYAALLVLSLKILTSHEKISCFLNRVSLDEIPHLSNLDWINDIFLYLMFIVY